MDRLKQVLETAAILVAMGFAGSALAQAPAPANPAQQGSAKPATTPPLQLRSLAPDAVADPFPPVNQKYFTAESPTVATVDSYLHAVLGYDANRIWRVMAIQKTAAPGVSKVTALVSEKTANAKVQQAIFFVTPDGKHLIADAGSGVLPFGADPYAAADALLKERADGPSHGAASKNLMLVEFADLECPHCKEAQPTMKRLAQDFPNARIVYENFPLVDIHPYAFKAAAYGVCVAKKSNDAFFTYEQAVYDTQTQLTADAADKTLDDAATKAGANAAAVATCAATPETKQKVDESIRLGNDVGVDQTPMLAVNGRLIPLGGIPYETIKEIIVFQATLDGVQAAAATPALAGPSPK
jgi:protein-disulfide isomerase